MQRIQFLLTLMLAMALLISQPTHAQTGNIGFNIQQVIDDLSAGLNGEYEYDGNGWGLEVDGNFQTGDIYRGKGHAELTFDVSYIGIKLISDLNAKGYTLDTIGKSNNLYIALTVPMESLNINLEGLNIDIGIGGKKATPWGAPNALSELVPKGYDETELEALGLANVTPAPRGVPFQDGAFLQAYFATGFSKNDVDIDVKGILQLTGAEKAHQLKTTFDTDRELEGNFVLNLFGEIVLMTYQDALHYETAGGIGIGYKW